MLRVLPGVFATALLPAAALAHPGHGGLPHGWETVLILLSILGWVLWRRRATRRN